MRRPTLSLLSIAAAVAGLVIAGCSASGSSGGRQQGHAESAAPALTLEVTGARRQRIEGWGAEIGSGTYLDPQAAPVGLSRAQLRRLERALYREAGINLLRIFGPGFPTNGSKGDGSLSARDGRWRLMRRAKRYGVRLLFTASDAPPSMKQGRNLAHGSERQFAAYIADNLSFARRQGAPFDFAALGNEIDNDLYFIFLKISADQAAKVYDFLAAEIARRRLPTKLALGDTENWASGVSYATAALRSSRVRSAAGVLATHGYGEDASRPAVAALARSHRLSLWMTEWTQSKCLKGTCPDTPDIGFALGWATRITRDLTNPSVNAWFLLRAVDDSTHGPDSGILVRTRGQASPFYRTKRFFVFRQFSSAAPPGARRLEVRGGAPALAFRKGKRLNLVVTNPDAGDKSATLRLGRTPGRMLIRRTSAHENFKRLRSRRYDGGRISVTLPARSVTTFTLVYGR